MQRPTLALALILSSAGAALAQSQSDKDIAVVGGLSVMGFLCAAGCFLLGLIVYVTPTIVALMRGHVNTASIIVVNLLLGWTVIGWIVALSWAFSAQERHRDDYGRRDRQRRYDD